MSERENTPNDLKLSDCGAGRGCCGKAVGVAAVVGAAAVTCVAVRWSAWLGVAVISGIIIGLVIAFLVRKFRQSRSANGRKSTFSIRPTWYRGLSGMRGPW